MDRLSTNYDKSNTAILSETIFVTDKHNVPEP